MQQFVETHADVVAALWPHQQVDGGDVWARSHQLLHQHLAHEASGTSHQHATSLEPLSYRTALAAPVCHASATRPANFKSAVI